MRTILILLIVVFASTLNAQKSEDYVILRSNNESTKTDSVFGKVLLPNNGVFWNVKIQTKFGKKKYKTKEVVGFQVGKQYFASIPYGKSYAIVPRLIDGKIDLYFYYTGSNRYKYINLKKNNYNELAVDLVNIIWNRTSFFYVYDPESNDFHKIPRSNKKFKDQITNVFKNNQEIYNRIINGYYKPKQIPEIVLLYNSKQ